MRLDRAVDQVVPEQRVGERASSAKSPAAVMARVTSPMTAL
jgi:hypothetical protein